MIQVDVEADDVSENSEVDVDGNSPQEACSPAIQDTLISDRYIFLQIFISKLIRYSGNLLENLQVIQKYFSHNAVFSNIF